MQGWVVGAAVGHATPESEKASLWWEEPGHALRASERRLVAKVMQ
jgi:hypothetical protein